MIEPDVRLVLADVTQGRDVAQKTYDAVLSAISQAPATITQDSSPPESAEGQAQTASDASAE